MTGAARETARSVAGRPAAAAGDGTTGTAPDDGTAAVEALLSAPGHEVLARVAAGRAAGEPPLALASRLRRDFPAPLVAAATAQDELRRAAGPKFSLARRMLFTRPGLEQASSEAAARHRARRLAGAAPQRLADLGCGIGGDLIALAVGREVLAVDRDPVHLRMAVHNAGVYGAAAGVRTCRSDVRDVSLAGVQAVFADPARRLPGGGRRLRPGDSEPPLEWCFALTGHVPAVAVKAAPGLPAGIVPGGWETEFVADGRDLKEAVLWSPALATAPARATILPEGHTLLPEPGKPCRWPRRAPSCSTRIRRSPGPAWWRNWAAGSAPGRSIPGSLSCPPIPPAARRSPVPSGSSSPARGTRRTSPGGCAPAGSAPLTFAAAAWPVTWIRSTAVSSWPARTGPRSCSPGPVTGPGG